MAKKIAGSRVLVALDVDTQEDALGIAFELVNECAGVKVGKRLFTSCGPQLVKKVNKLGVSNFLDLKYHDIPNTVVEASVEAAKLGVKMFNMHTLGGLRMMGDAREAVEKHVSQNASLQLPKMIGVTILTSHGYESLVGIGILPELYIADPIQLEVEKKKRMSDLVLKLALLAKKAGLHGVVASPQETELIRKACGEDFLIVTPGIRPVGASVDDQVRIATPAGAIKNGADYLVIGRPIIGQPKGQRLEALRKINEEVALALTQK